ncbi:multicopper oxidase domain-containing protein [Cohnella fermenti]|uniref:Copper-containing nitrite reductase n=1 Tax=Cohnella fermenti TaxID=2565925 RepID=A0A4S4BML9_9BACL|nr:multicopper oxidase domain-containing protein [Cohnella fermenti]THF76076.1 nitrite reductase [Cohnella fermenti]
MPLHPWKFAVLLAAALSLAACRSDAGTEAEGASAAPSAQVIDQAPVEPIVTREGDVVHIELTAQVTNVEIAEDEYYRAWTFNGTVPGPVLRVREGDTIQLTLRNLDPNMPHSMDLHAVQASPSGKFVDIMPDEQGTFTYTADSPGVFMYHCGTKPVLLHIGNGMYGMIIVEPKNGYSTDAGVDREYMLVQSEWYADNSIDAMLHGESKYVVFNGNDYALNEQPLLAKVGDRIRLYVVNAGPNEVSSFHVVGAIFDRVYESGNPANVQRGIQTTLIPAGGGSVVEFTVQEAGDYPIVSHQFDQATKGAVATLRVTEDGRDNGEPAMGH